MIYNSRFFDYKYIFNTVTRKYRRKVFYEDDFLSWCAQVETQVIPDIDLMTKFENIGIEVVNNILALPCNVFRLEDIFDSGEDYLRKYDNNGNYLYNMIDSNGNAIVNGDTIYLNYTGTNVDLETGIPLCVQGHQFVCETYCKIQAFEEDVSLNNFSANLYAAWMQSLGGLIAAAKQDIYQHKERNEINKITIIKGNMLPRIGNLPLKHKQFNDDTSTKNLLP